MPGNLKRLITTAETATAKKKKKKKKIYTLLKTYLNAKEGDLDHWQEVAAASLFRTRSNLALSFFFSLFSLCDGVENPNASVYSPR